MCSASRRADAAQNTLSFALYPFFVGVVFPCPLLVDSGAGVLVRVGWGFGVPERDFERVRMFRECRLTITDRLVVVEVALGVGERDEKRTFLPLIRGASLAMLARTALLILWPSLSRRSMRRVRACCA